MTLSTWYRRTSTGWEILVHAQPGAKKTAIAGKHGDALKIRVHAPPVDGRANDELVAFLAERLGIPKRAIELVSGERARDKRFAISAPDAPVPELELH